MTIFCFARNIYFYSKTGLITDHHLNDLNHLKYRTMTKKESSQHNRSDYYNSPDLDSDVIYNYLARGLRTPQNDMERQWAEEGKKILAEGKSYEISFN
jgi:hypothetical protein